MRASTGSMVCITGRSSTGRTSAGRTVAHCPSAASRTITCVLLDQSRICYASGMKMETNQNRDFMLALAWSRLERRLDSGLGAIRGISLAEFRLLKALGDSPDVRAGSISPQPSRMTPSGVTRALRKLGGRFDGQEQADSPPRDCGPDAGQGAAWRRRDGCRSDTMRVLLQRSPKGRDQRTR